MNSKDFPAEIKNFYSDFVNKSESFFVVFKKNGYIDYYNDFFEDLFEKRDLPKNIFEFIPEISDENIFKKRLTEKKPFLFNFTIGLRIPISFYCHLRKNKDIYVLMGFISFFEMEKLQLHIMETNTQLNNLARELSKKNVELAKANNLKNQLMGIAAHDLRNPIGVINSYTEFLLMDEKIHGDSELKKIIDTIRRMSDYSLMLVRDYLDYSKIEEGQINLELKNIDIIKLLKKQVSISRILSSNKDITIKTNFSCDSFFFKADKLKFSQVIDNLITNAIKFSHKGEKIILSAEKINEDVLEIRVKDFGVGIPENKLSTIFDPFTKNSTKGTSGERGTGLGLTIAKQIVQAHNGKIKVESKSGKGSVFIITLSKKGFKND